MINLDAKGKREWEWGKNLDYGDLSDKKSYRVSSMAWIYYCYTLKGDIGGVKGYNE